MFLSMASIHNSLKVENLGFGIRVYRVQGVGLRFGVGDLGFRVRGSGFRV